MPNITLFLTNVFVGFFAILNTIGTGFLSMVGDTDEKIIKKVAFRAVLVAFVNNYIFCLFGH